MTQSPSTEKSPATEGSGATGPRVIVIGAGFAGLSATKHLAGHGMQVTIVDRNNFHTFQPFL
jgi:NADH dehydrogenase